MTNLFTFNFVRKSQARKPRQAKDQAKPKKPSQRPSQAKNQAKKPSKAQNQAKPIQATNFFSVSKPSHKNLLACRGLGLAIFNCGRITRVNRTLFIFKL
jgi:hypothetical protein